jgi:anti-sigma factor RsiW
MEDEEEHPEEVALLDYVVGDLAPDSSDAIRQHVERCADCRERIVDLAMEMDEIDRLPTVAIPHDVLRGVFPAAPRRGRALLPVLALLAVGCGIFALFQIGGLRGEQPLTPQRQVILRTDVALPEQLVADALGDVPSRITVDRDDDRHLVVLVSDADLGIAYDRLAAIADGTGRSYIVDVGGAGVLPGSAP